MRRISRISSLALAGVVLAVGLGDHLSSRDAAASELKRVTARLAFTYNGHRSPYLLGKDKGFYEEEGLDVEVLEGKGVTSSMQLVASKQDTFAIVDPPSLMLGVAQGMPIRMVVQLYQRSPNALISWDGANIRTPRDLVGKAVATLQGDTTTTMLYALLAKNGVAASQVRIFAADGGTRTQMFLGKRTEAITGFYNDSYLGLKSTAGDVSYFLYSDYGIDTMGDGVAAHIDTIQSSPEIVRAFVKATLRAYTYALEHPEEAIDSLLKRSPNAKREVEIEKLKATASLVESPDTRSRGMGFSSKEKWQAAEALMVEFGGLRKRAARIEDYYTNDFLPRR